MKQPSDAPAPVLTGAELFDLQQKLLTLLARQAALYTKGESSSLPVETAQELLCSLCYCLGIHPKRPDARWQKLSAGDVDKAYRAGQCRIRSKVLCGKRLWRTVCTHLPPVQNVFLQDTLKGIGGFWQNYNARFFAHDIPCTIDYPLAMPVPDTLLGVDYINAYLSELWREARFLRCFSAAALTPVLTRSSPDYRALPVNLFEPVFVNTLGLALLGRTDGAPLLQKSEFDPLCRLLDALPPKELAPRLCAVAEQLFRAQGLPGLWPQDALVRYCSALSARICALRDCGGLGGVFLHC